MPQGRPNILFYFTDQQRWDTVGAYGQPLEVTPNLDRMAAEGVLVRRAFTCQPVCGPARSCLQTGKWATQTGCYRNDVALPLDERTVAHWLSALGYEAGYVGKWHLASSGDSPNYRTRPVPPLRRGGYNDWWVASDVLEFTSHSYDGHMFDADGERRDFPEGRYRVDCVTDFAEEFIRSRTGDRPWYLMVSHIEPHHQNDNNRYEGPHGSREQFADFVVPGDLKGTEGDWRENYPDYLGCCHALDANLGRLRGVLDELGMAEDTLIIYTSDHGSHFRTRNNEYKRACHDGCIRIPMVLCGPGFRGGKELGALVNLIDVPPTILAAAGADEIPATVVGRPLQDAVDDVPEDWRDEVFLQISESHVGRAIRTDRWKYSVRAPDKKGWEHMDSGLYVEDHLYDLEADPHERNNLVSDPDLADVRADLRARLLKRMVQAGEAKPTIEPAPTAT